MIVYGLDTRNRKSAFIIGHCSGYKRTTLFGFYHNIYIRNCRFIRFAIYHAGNSKGLYLRTNYRRCYYENEYKEQPYFIHHLNL